VVDDLYGSVQDLLIAWARWRSFAHGANVGYPHKAAFCRDMRTPGRGTVRIAALPDDVGCQVDSAVSQLKLRSEPIKNDHRWQVLTDAYLCGMTDGQIARERKISRGTVRTARMAAENWIEGRLY